MATTEATSFDVIIIGGGPAGLGAGIELSKEKANLKYLILEARNRIGGRAFTDTTTFGPKIPVDIGAHYLCHHQEGNILRQYYVPSDRDFIESDAYDPTTMKIYNEDGRVIAKDLIHQAMEITDNLFEMVAVDPEDASDSSMLASIEDRLNSISDHELKSLVKMCLSYTELHEGSDLNELSSKQYGKGEGDLEESDLSLTHGLGTLVKDIASKYPLSIELNSVVTQIDLTSETNGMIRVQTETNSSYTCKYVLITVPLGCLKSNTIVFSPPLPQWKQEAIQQMGFSLLNKIYLQFSDIFWEKNLRRISVVSDQFKFYYCLSEYSMLVLYVSGSTARQSEEKTDATIIEEIFQSLRRIYPSISYPIKWLITRWGSDRFSRGSYSSFHLGTDLNTLKELSRETHDGRIHWGGEHTNYEGSIGYVDSGFESGIREARRILQKLQ